MSGKKRPAGTSTARQRLLAERAAEAERLRKRRLLIGVLVGALALVLVGGAAWYGWWTATRTPTATAQPNAGVTFAPANPPGTLPPSGAPMAGLRIGSATAPNTVTVYLDFLCSHCHEFERTFGPALAKLQDEGRVVVEYHPMAFLAPPSLPAANAFRCAADIDPRFGRSLHDALFTNDGTSWTSDKLVTLGRSLKPDAPPSYDTCVTTGQNAAWVKDITTAGFNGPAKQGTPTVYVNGAHFEVNQTPAQLQALLR